MPKKIKDPGRRTTRECTYLYDDEVEALRERAFKDRMSKSEVLRRALREYLGDI